MAGKNKKIGGGGFHHVFLKVSDLNRSIKFYTEALGFVEKVSWGEGAQRLVLLDAIDREVAPIEREDRREPLPLGQI